MTLLKKLSAMAILAGALSSANATLINFAALADGPLGEGPITSYSNAGITITFKAGKGANAAHAYLDEKSNGLVGGLGVCGAVYTTGPSANECNPATDDNIQVGEWVSLKFNTDVVIDKMWYNNNHEKGLVTGNKVLVNGVAKGVVDPSATGGKGRGLVEDDYFIAAGNSITYAYDPSGRQFYVEAMELRAVPEPTTIGLFGLGLGLMGFALRRRKV